MTSYHREEKKAFEVREAQAIQGASINFYNNPTVSLPLTDLVNNPPHYNHNPMGVECIKAIEASMTPEEFRGYLKGNIIKYLWRYSYKDGIKDIKKGQWYISLLSERVSQAELNKELDKVAACTNSLHQSPSAP